MKKDIKDYLHLYLGQPCIVTDSDGNDHEYTIDDKALFYLSGIVQPVLRPLSDMKEGERAALWDFIFKDRRYPFNGRTVWYQERTTSSEPRWVLMQGVERLGIEMNGTVWADSDLNNYKHNQHEVTRWFLSKGFDLYGLIEAGLAIDWTIYTLKVK